MLGIPWKPGWAVDIAGKTSTGYRFPLARLPVTGLAVGIAACAVGHARTLLVGPGQDYARPSDAAHVAAEGDTVRIMPGTYYDCAVWSADSLVIEGTGPDTVLTDTACQGKASFIVAGRDVTVRGLTFARIRVPDGNGAGIRAEGPGLLVERVRFENNQDGILAAALPAGTLRVVGCSFTRTGTSSSAHISAALVIGSMDRLVVQGTTFEAGEAGSSVIVSDARVTEIEGSTITSASGASVQVSGGLVIEDTTLQPAAAGRRAAVLALPGAAPGAPLALRRNTLAGEGTLLLNWSGRTPILDANQLGPSGILQSSAGAWSYQLRRAARYAYDAARGAAHKLVRRILDMGANR